MKDKIASRLKNLFVGRSDVYATQFLQETKKGKEKGFKCERKEITIDSIKKHLEQKEHLGVYDLDKNNNVIKGCFDFDRNTMIDFECMKVLYKFLKEKGYHPLAELSKGGEYKTHLWIFSDKPISAKQMQEFMSWCLKETNVKPHECFPKQDELNFEADANAVGNLVKLPLGKHLVTELTSTFLKDNFEEATSEEDILKILEYHFDNKDSIPAIQQEIKEDKKEEQKEILIPSANPNDWDEFFTFVLNNELPEGISKEVKIGTKEGGINNNILKNMGLWFYQKGYTIKKLEEEIKPIFQEKGFVFGDLKGWFKKAENKTIKEIATGELILWCKEYYPALLNYVPEDVPYLKPEDIQDKTDHLPHFDLIHKIIPLEGNEYTQIKKGAYEQLISLACPEDKLLFKVGNIETDLRIHNLNILPSGKGKLEIKEGIKQTYQEFKPDANIKEPRTIHFQQLIGKVLQRKEKNEETGKKQTKFIKKFGFIFADLLILEEGYEIFNSNEKNDKDCRDALIVGLDIYNKNFVAKQNIDNLDTDEETISGFPKVNCLAFSQPLPFREEFITKGLQRRFNVHFKEFPEKTKTDNFVSRLISKTRDRKAIIEFATFMRKINNLKGDWVFSKDAFESFILCHQAILEQGYTQGGKQYHFTKILEYPMQNLLLKTSALRSLSNLRTTITKEDVENAFVDIIERFTHELIFVDSKIKGTLDYGSSWGGAIGKKQECLQWLHKKGSTSKDNSKTKINYFQIQISQIYDISIRRAKDRYKELKADGLIDDWLGQSGENKVWITFEPKISKPKIMKEVIPKLIYRKLSGMTQKTDMSGMTPNKSIFQKEITHKNNSDMSGMTDMTQKTRESLPNNLSLYKNIKKSSMSVIPVNGDLAVIPEKEINFKDSGILEEFESG